VLKFVGNQIVNNYGAARHEHGDQGTPVMLPAGHCGRRHSSGRGKLRMLLARIVARPTRDYAP
jgi:hypothetical protein